MTEAPFPGKSRWVLPVWKVVGVVPARFGSERWPGKVLENVGGKALLRRAWETLSGVPEISEVLIATDDSRVETWAGANGLCVVKTSAECRNGTERTAEIARMIRADYFVNVQADQVGLEPRVVTALLRAAKAHPEWAITTAGTRWYDAGCLKNRDRVFFSARECTCGRHSIAERFFRGGEKRANTNGPVLRHLGVYGYSPAFLREYAANEPSQDEITLHLEQCRALQMGVEIGVVRVRTSARSVDSAMDRDAIERSWSNRKRQRRPT